MAITLRQLEIFSQVAQSGSITRASKQLYLTQAAISMAIAELERLVGTTVFERHGKRLLLNDQGRAILPQVLEVLAKVDQIQDHLSQAAGIPCGTLNVGASTTIGNYILPTVIGEFSEQYPQAKALLSVGNARQIETGLDSGELDIGLTEGVPHLRTLTAEPWRRDELVIIVGSNHPWARKSKIALKALSEAAWIMREIGSGTREIFEAALQKKQVDFHIALELGHTEAIKKAVEAGLGISCLSRMAVQRELDNGWLVEVQAPLNLERTLYILTRNSAQKTLLLKSFLLQLAKYQNQ
ncbi:MAG: LysR family transcriptional regulator [Desulfuromonadales bacterium]|nr:LysR family transcriptional regulator [Desulfuromonadales bacterium]MBN2791131.1 LysR family transcriptional regulator [Desulfuromonadales bacterium]